ncbi:hypothetical protein [Demequina salsinemoris]|uniref:hypothetical protein n=1 Tax=Demequina salsinemoris TaxID=577470 RepID=UPI000780E4CF|nr:hypothetical protein [Demequina salsinemoris]
MSDLGEVLHDGTDRVGGQIDARGDSALRSAAAWQRIRSRRQRRAAWYTAGTVSAVAVVAFVASGVGGSVLDASPVQPAASANSCDRGEPSVESAVRGFLEAAQDGDVDAVTAELLVGLEADADSVAELQGIIGDAEADSLRLSVTQPTSLTRYTVKVSTADGDDLGRYAVGEMVDQHPGCFAVEWGQSLPSDPSASVTPSASTVRYPLSFGMFEDYATAPVAFGDGANGGWTYAIDLVDAQTASITLSHVVLTGDPDQDAFIRFYLVLSEQITGSTPLYDDDALVGYMYPLTQEISANRLIELGGSEESTLTTRFDANEVSELAAIVVGDAVWSDEVDAGGVSIGDDGFVSYGEEEPSPAY